MRPERPEGKLDSHIAKEKARIRKRKYCGWIVWKIYSISLDMIAFIFHDDLL